MYHGTCIMYLHFFYPFNCSLIYKICHTMCGNCVPGKVPSVALKNLALPTFQLFYCAQLISHHLTKDLGSEFCIIELIPSIVSTGSKTTLLSAPLRVIPSKVRSHCTALM